MKKNNIKNSEILPLVPSWLLLPLWFISLGLPNLIYSGVNFADTLHILKWTVTGVPIAVAVFTAGARMFLYGSERVKIKFDIFSIIWALILIYCALHGLWMWTDLASPNAFVLEMLCFVSVWAFYVISISSFPEWGLRPVLILGNINAAVNVIFAELQIHELSDFSFLRGTFLEPLMRYSTIILPTPGNYIGNTAQQNMFGLWVSVSVLGAVYLYVYDAWKSEPDERGAKIWLPAVSLISAVINLKFAVADSVFACKILAAIFILTAFISAWRLGNKRHLYYSVFILIFAGWNFWGLMGSTSRSAVLGLIIGLTALLIYTALKFNRNYVIRFFAVLALILTVFWASFYTPRSADIVGKTQDIIKNYQSIGLRRGIWATSIALFTEHPEGVGIGQYKWHYLDGQRAGFKLFDNPNWYDWQYTHWAHNEFLQFFCEGGLIGGIMFLLMYFTWFIPAFKGLLNRKKEVSMTAVWGASLAALITFCAVFTRPFHRIENMVWITLAFSLSNREFLRSFSVKSSKIAGALCILASIAGCVYISSGIYGNYLLRQGMLSGHPKVRLYFFEQAEKHPIVHEDAMRNTALYYINIGEQTNDLEALAKGFNMLWEQFKREPHSEDISRLLHYSQRFQVEDVLKELKSYFKPGTYHLQRVPQKNSDGRTINALLIVNGPGSDDE